MRQNITFGVLELYSESDVQRIANVTMANMTIFFLRIPPLIRYINCMLLED